MPYVRDILLAIFCVCEFQLMYSFTVNPRKLNTVTCSIRVLFIIRRQHIDSSSIIVHPINFDIPRERSLKISCRELDIYHYYRHKQCDNQYGFSISIGNTTKFIGRGYKH